MSAFGLKPKFADKDGYLKWRVQWRVIFKETSADLRLTKILVKKYQRENGISLQKNYLMKKAMAFKLMGILQEAKDRAKRIKAIHLQIAEQNKQFPLKFDDCRVVDFHYNRGANEFSFLPIWILKLKGKSYYVNTVEAECCFSTRELDQGSTRGMIRFRNCSVEIDQKGDARIF